MIRRRRMLLAMPAIVPIGGLLWGLPPPSGPSVRAEWLDREGRFLRRVYWRKRRDGVFVPATEAVLPPEFFSRPDGARSVRLTNLRSQRPISWPASFYGKGTSDGGSRLLELNFRPPSVVAGPVSA